MTHLRRAATRDVILGVVAVLVIGAAIYFFSKMRVGGSASTTDFVPMHCRACKADFKLSYAEIDDLTQAKKFSVPPGEKTMLFKCPKCGQMAASRGADPNQPAPPPGVSQD